MMGSYQGEGWTEHELTPVAASVMCDRVVYLEWRVLSVFGIVHWYHLRP